MRTDIQRFLEAQEESYNQAFSEIKNGRKTSHWIWYIFPQVKGLGFSYNSQYYGISSLKEASDYLDDKILGKRLNDICECLLLHKGEDIEKIMGGIDAMKLKSSMTLFDIVCPDSIFGQVLDVFFRRERCRKTLKILEPFL